jgi:hypothetical protein
LRHTHHPLVPFARVQSMSRVDVFVDHRDPVRREPAIATNDPSMGFCFPSASPADSSDLHRVCLTRLCSVLRFSQPLDALLRRQPLGLVSCRIHPWVLAFRGFPLPVAATPFGAPCPPCPSCGRLAGGNAIKLRLTPLTSRIAASGRSVLDGSGVIRIPSAVPLLAVLPSEVFSPRTSTSPVTATSPLMGFCTSPAGSANRAWSHARTPRRVPCAPPPWPYMLCRVSKIRGAACLFRELPPPLGFASSSNRSSFRTGLFLMLFLMLF